MAKDDWSDLSDCFYEMAGDTVQEAKKDIVRSFMHNVAQPLTASGYAPVDTGNWIANNVVVYNTPNDEENDSRDEDGLMTTLRADYKVEQSKPFQTVAVQNNTEYNLEVEYTGWTNKSGTVTTTPPYRPYRTAFEKLRDSIK